MCIFVIFKNSKQNEHRTGADKNESGDTSCTLRKSIHLSSQLMVFTFILGAFLICGLVIFFTSCHRQEFVAGNNGIKYQKEKRRENENVLNVNNESATKNETFSIISRTEWNATIPLYPALPLNSSNLYVIVHHTSTSFCNNKPRCSYITRIIQLFHIKNRGFWDIGYNFLIGGDGNVYEGRGWNSTGAHTYQWNSRSIGVAFIGNYERDTPISNQMAAFQNLLNEGLYNGMLDSDYKIYGAAQIVNTLSPGKNIMDAIEKLPRWSRDLV